MTEQEYQELEKRLEEKGLELKLNDTPKGRRYAIYDKEGRRVVAGNDYTMRIEDVETWYCANIKNREESLSMKKHVVKEEKPVLSVEQDGEYIVFTASLDYFMEIARVLGSGFRLDDRDPKAVKIQEFFKVAAEKLKSFYSQADVPF